VDISPWGAIVVPANTPRDIVERLSRELNALYAKPDFRAQMDRYGLLLQGGTPDETAAFLRDQLAAWARAARQAKLPIE
jgi:tripartite-type tricarboxylate transporter receptor subunit TctC